MTKQKLDYSSLRCPKCKSTNVKENHYRGGGYYGIDPWIYDKKCLDCKHEESLCSDTHSSSQSTFLYRNQDEYRIRREREKSLEKFAQLFEELGIKALPKTLRRKAYETLRKEFKDAN